MSLNISLNTIIPASSNHTVSISAGSGVTASTSTSGTSSITNYSFTATSGVEKTVATITFTAKTNFAYSKFPKFNITSISSSSSYSVSETDTIDSNGNLTARSFVFKYTSTAVSNTDKILFNYRLKSIRPVLNEFNKALLEITSVEIDNSFLSFTSSSRNISIFGDENSVFNLKITKSNDSKTYDFDTNEFTTSSTQLTNQTLDSSGVFNFLIQFPAGGNLTYDFEVIPVFSKGTTLNSSLRDTNDNFKHSFSISQFSEIGVVFQTASSANSSSYSSLPNSQQIKGSYNQVSETTHRVSVDLVLSSNAFKIAKQLDEEDIETSTTATTSSTTSSSTGPITLSDVSKLIIGMKISGTGVSGTPTIASISSADSTITFSNNQSISSGVTLTFTGVGEESSLAIFGTTFTIVDSSLTLVDVKTTINDNSADGGLIADADVASANGILAADTTIISGLNIPENVHIDSVNSNNLEFSQSLALINGQNVIFTGSSRNATLTFNVVITKFGVLDTSLNINLDNLLTVA
tara:strand:- start:3061 stop:4626 length:1566 start_codon:yes stop_codon:yes gene_type:complete